MSDTSEQRAMWQGQAARRAGLSWKTNPYDSKKRYGDWLYWNIGWGCKNPNDPSRG